MTKSIKTAAEILKFRLRMEIALRDAAPPAPATPDELDRLVAWQTAYWADRTVSTGAAAHQALNDLNDRSISAFVFSIRGRHVRLWPKRAFSFPAGEETLRRGEQQTFARRATLYRAFIEKVVRRSRLQYSIDFALDVNDYPEDHPDYPIFAFQKERSAHNILLPDVDFFHSKWYLKDHDSLPYESKLVSACFVGSSTGAWLSVEGIRRLEAPRLRAAAYFHGNPRVYFRIANAVQCLSEEARSTLMSQPYYTDFVSWQDQLRHRFIISMDGNGAACSRLVKGLRSNSVVIKFESPYELYYFPALVAGRDYVSVEDEQGVERIIEIEAENPGTFKSFTVAGQQFSAKYHNIRSVMDYTARLLTAFAARGA